MRKFFEFQNAAKINCGEAALSTVGKELSYLGAKKPLVLLSANAVKLGVKAKILNTLTGCDLKGVAVAEPVPAEVNLDYARGQKKLYLKEKCDALIAVGGDEVMDTAKCVKLLLSQELDEILPIVAESAVKGKNVPFIAIPSENGSGKEANGFVEAGEYYLSSPVLVPDVVIIDEDVAMAAPAREVAACGAYALANAIEAYVESEEPDVAGIYAEKAISLLAKNLLPAVTDGDNAEACRATALAGTLAGVAYGATPYGPAHALAEGLHAVTGEPLEEMFALTLIPAIKRAREKYEDKIKTLYYLLVGATEYAETPDSERADRAVASVEWLLSSLHSSGNLPTKISETKIEREQFGAIADEAANKRASITAFGPIGKDEFIAMLNDAY